MSAALCAHKCRACSNDAKQSIVSYIPEGALIKRWASPVCKCALPTSEDLYLDSEKGMMVLSSGRCAPCSLASSIEDSTSRPSELRKRTLVLVLGQVVLTEPLRFRLGHPMDHSNAAGSFLVASLPEMRTAHARMSIDGICVQVRGNVVRSFSCEKLNLADFDERRSAFLHFAGAKRRRAQQKAVRAASNFVGGTLPLAFAR